MSLGLAIFAVVVFATFFNNALHFYTHVQTYPLFAWVDRDGFVPFHKEYERRLPLAIYAPYSLLMAANALLLFFRPAEVAAGWVIVLLILNASIAVVSVALAAPVHRRMDRQTRNDKGEVGRLIRLNGVRLAAATAGSVLVAYLLVGALAP